MHAYNCALGLVLLSHSPYLMGGLSYCSKMILTSYQQLKQVQKTAGVSIF